MRFIVSLVVAAALVSCTKKRSDSFVQGHGRDLLLISDYDGKEFPVATLGLIAGFKENPTVTKSEKITASAKMAATHMGAVKVETKADLLADAPFIAVPNMPTGYKIKYQITNDYLIVLKIAKKELIHSKEFPGAVDQGNGEWGVPLVGYPLRGLVNTERVDTGTGKSSKIMEMSVTDKSNAKYFKIDKNNRVLYKHQDKLDLFTKDYFAGDDGNSEWYFAQTIIAAGGAYADYSGWVLAQQDNDLNALSKVKFTFGRNEMSAISINIDSRIDNKDEINQMPLVKFPIEWKEFRPTPVGAKGIGMTEEENTAVDWQSRRFVRVDFGGASTLAISSPSFKFVDLEVDTDYFSYVVYDAEHNLRIKQSFLRDKGRKAYTPKRLFKEDFEKFGFFSTQKNEIKNYEKYREDDFGKNIFINRYNVANGVIEFYFTEGSDEKMIPYAAKAADEWSEAFQKAGVPLKVVAITDPSKRKKLGDVRYNQINLIRSANESNLFGYGPSITDPRTGEIISATTNMHLTSIVSALVSHIRDYLLFKSNKTKQLSVFVSPPELTTNIAVKGDKVAMSTGSPYDIPASKLLKKFPVSNLNGQVEMKEIVVPEPTITKDNNGRMKFPKNWGREFDISVTGKNLNHEIEKMCPELESVTTAWEKDSFTDEDNKTVIACAEKLLPAKMFGTLLHEMGHNFGLRHNFYGSVDAMNFLSKARTQTDTQVKSSSVMEYSAFGEDRLTKVGLYDIAAIRYGYGDAVETNNCSVNADGEKACEIKKLNVGMNIAKNLGENGNLRPYMFCTDEDVAVGTDPLCARHDAGTNANEVADHLINEFNASIADYNYRLGRQRKIDPMRLTNYRIQRYWIPLKRLYDEWRYKLNDYLGTGNEYLEAFDERKLDTMINEKIAKCDEKTDPNSNECQFKHYKAAADRIFNFTMQMATLPPKYCIGSRNGNLASVEFADVRRIIMSTDKVVPKSCLDENVKKYIQSKFAFTPDMESGYELEDVRLDMKVKMSGKTDWFGNPIPDPPDIIGLMPEKMIAMEVMAVRAALSMSSQEKPFKPNFLDEPRYRQHVLAYVADRISKGINASRVLSGDKVKGSKLFLEKFKYEKKYIDNMVSSIFYGMDVPDKSLATKQRKKKFLVKYTDKKEILDKAKYKVAGLDGTTFYAIMSEDATEAKKLLEMLEILPKRLEAASPLTEKTFDAFIELVDNVLGKETAIDSTKLAEFLHGVLDDEFNESNCQNKPSPRTKEALEVDKFRAHWKKIMGPELALFRPKIQEIFTPGSGDGSFSIAACQYNGSLASWYPVTGENLLKELKAKDANYNLNKAMLVDRIEKYKAESEKQAKTQVSDDVYNYEELSTQMELIMNMLRNNIDY